MHTHMCVYLLDDLCQPHMRRRIHAHTHTCVPARQPLPTAPFPFAVCVCACILLLICMYPPPHIYLLHDLCQPLLFPLLDFQPFFQFLDLARIPQSVKRDLYKCQRDLIQQKRSFNSHTWPASPPPRLFAPTPPHQPQQREGYSKLPAVFSTRTSQAASSS